MNTSQEWCLDPLHIKEVLWNLADPDRESTVIIGPNVFINKVRQTIRKSLIYREREEMYGIRGEIYKLWGILKECPEEDISVCSDEILGL